MSTGPYHCKYHVGISLADGQTGVVRKEDLLTSFLHLLLSAYLCSELSSPSPLNTLGLECRNKAAKPSADGQRQPGAPGPRGFATAPSSLPYSHQGRSLKGPSLCSTWAFFTRWMQHVARLSRAEYSTLHKFKHCIHLHNFLWGGWGGQDMPQVKSSTLFLPFRICQVRQEKTGGCPPLTAC